MRGRGGQSRPLGLRRGHCPPRPTPRFQTLAVRTEGRNFLRLGPWLAWLCSRSLGVLFRQWTVLELKTVSPDHKVSTDELMGHATQVHWGP